MISLTTYNELSTKFAEAQTEITALREKLAAAEASLAERGRMLETTHRVQRAYRAAVAAALAELLSTVTGLPVSDYSTDGDGAELVRQDSVIAAVKTAIAALGLAEKEQQ